MTQGNRHLQTLPKHYLFPEIALRKEQFLQAHPGAHLLSCGVGDTTLPLPPVVIAAMEEEVARLGEAATYKGYGPEAGDSQLREAIAHVHYEGISPEEIFISDGAKCDVARLQLLFGERLNVGVQDPSYPPYIECAQLRGHTVHRLSDFSSLPPLDLLYLCSPHNPTGEVLTRGELSHLVSQAHTHSFLIIFDAAYAAFIDDSFLPKTIYAIPGAEEVAIEIGSFSKSVGFTGVRLGWSVVPKRLTFADGTPVQAQWSRLLSLLFNGPSRIAQAGGLAALTPAGIEETARLVATYKENSRLLKEALTDYTVTGGDHAPYLWVDCRPHTSWEQFDHFLETYEVITTPGSGFGPGGEGFLRLSAFAPRSDILTITRRLHAADCQACR